MPSYYLVSISDSLGTFNFPTPSVYNATSSTIVDGARNTDGNMVGTFIKELSKIEMSWRYLTATQWSNILKEFLESQGKSFIRKVKFLNQDTNTYETKDMYISDRNAGGFKYNETTGNMQGYTDCSLSLVEV